MSALWIFLPVLGAPLRARAGPAPWTCCEGLKRRSTAARRWRGRRILGDNKTWRGATAHDRRLVLATVVLWSWPAWRAMTPGRGRATSSPLLVGAPIGLGDGGGELPNSFLKRRLDIAPGPAPALAGGLALALLDQRDLVLGIWVCLSRSGSCRCGSPRSPLS